LQKEQILGALLIAVVAFVAIVGGAWFGAFLRTVLPDHHLTHETESAVRIGVGLIATMAALVLGFLLASAKGSFDTKSDEVRQSAAKLVLLDRNLRQYGPDADLIRAQLLAAARANLEHKWVNTEPFATTVNETSFGSEPLVLEQVQEKIRELVPATQTQRFVQTRALQVSGELAQTRWLLVEQVGGSIPTPFLVLLVLWLALIFASLSLFAPRNWTVNAVFIACALSVSSAIFLIIEMDRPFGGLLHISDAPFRSAISYLAR
jgi:hypothetical protein